MRLATVDDADLDVAVAALDPLGERLGQAIGGAFATDHRDDLAAAAEEPCDDVDGDLLEVGPHDDDVTRHGAVAIASKQALTSAGPCEPGDVLGAVAGDVVIVGADLEEVAVEVVARLLSSGGELVTVIGGADAPEGLAAALGERIERGHRDVEVSVIDGGQPHYPLLLGVE